LLINLGAKLQVDIKIKLPRGYDMFNIIWGFLNMNFT